MSTSAHILPSRSSELSRLPETVSASVPLTSLKVGDSAVLCEVCDARVYSLLRSLGLTGGGHFRVSRTGDPCIIQVRSTRIGLSKAVADSVFVTADGAPV